MPKIKWSLNVLVYFTASFFWCIFSGTSWSSSLFMHKHCLTIVGNSLSMMLIFGIMTLFLNACGVLYYCLTSWIILCYLMIMIGLFWSHGCILL